MEIFIVEYLELVFDPFINPRKRIFLGYRLAALIFAFANQRYIVGHTFRQATAELFTKSIWWSKSARRDYSIMIVRKNCR